MVISGTQSTRLTETVIVQLFDRAHDAGCAVAHLCAAVADPALWPRRTPVIPSEAESCPLVAAGADITSYTIHETPTDKTTVPPGRGCSRWERDVDALRAK